eukprot:8475243-Ditylum_brightwellii.AAC.1
MGSWPPIAAVGDHLARRRLHSSLLAQAQGQGASPPLTCRASSTAAVLFTPERCVGHPSVHGHA